MVRRSPLSAPFNEGARSKTHFIGISIITLATALPFAPALKGESLFYGDIILQFIPWRQFASKCIASGYVPLWNPYIYCGMPFLANGQSAIFYPFNWLGIFIPPHTLITLGALLHTMLCSWLTYALLVYIGCSPISSSAGATAYALSSFVLGHAQFPSLHYTISWLPAMVLAAEILARRKDFISSLPLAFVSAISFLCGHAQVWMLSIAFAIFWGCLRWANFNSLAEALRCAILMIASVTIACALTAIQWLPQVELLMHSAHLKVPFEEATLLSMPPWQLPNLFIPNLFGHPARGFYWGVGNYWDVAMHVGAVTTALAIYAAFDKHLKAIRLPIMAMMAAGCLLSLGRFMPLYEWLYERLPLMSSIRAPVRFSLWAVFSIALLAAFGTERLIEDLSRSHERRVLTFRRWLMIGAMALLVLAIGLLKLQPLKSSFKALFNVTASAAELVIPTDQLDATQMVAMAASSTALFSAACFLLVLSLALMVIGCKHSQPKWLAKSICFASPWVLPAVLTSELLIAINGINPFSNCIPWHKASLPKQLQEHINRHQWRIILREQDIRRCWYAFISYTSYSTRSEMERQLAGLLNALVPNTNMQFELLSAQGYDPMKPLGYIALLRELEHNEEAMRWLGVRYIIKVTPTKWRCKEARHEALISDVKAEAVSVSNPLPRAFVTFDPPSFLRMIGSPSLPQLPTQCNEAKIIRQANPNMVVCELPHPQHGLRVCFHYILDSAWCGWRAFVDGHEVAWSYVHPAARAIPITRSNAARVVWAYLPTAHSVGVYIGMFSLLLIAAHGIAMLAARRRLQWRAQ